MKSVPTRRRLAFVAAEVLLFSLVPLFGYLGFMTLLETRTGTFIADPVEGEPGWRALVDPSPVTAVIEVENDRITGLSVLTQPGGGAQGGHLILVPGTLLVEGTPLTARDPEGAARALGSAMRLQIGKIIVLNEEAWQSLLGETSYLIDVPDPIPNDADGILLPVGPNPIGAATTPAFLGRLVVGNDPLSLLFRRRLFWESVMDAPPISSHELGPILVAMSAGIASIHDFPIESTDILGPQALLVPDELGVEFLVREAVPFPAGAGPGDRVQVRLIDRNGTADLYELAAALGRQGIEILEIGNTWEYDNGPTEVVVPVGYGDVGITRLAQLVGADTVQAGDSDFEGSLTLLVGADVVVPGF
jgi:hypothetical protein